MSGNGANPYITMPPLPSLMLSQNTELYFIIAIKLNFYPELLKRNCTDILSQAMVGKGK